MLYYDVPVPLCSLAPLGSIWRVTQPAGEIEKAPERFCVATARGDRVYGAWCAWQKKIGNDSPVVASANRWRRSRRSKLGVDIGINIRRLEPWRTGPTSLKNEGEQATDQPAATRSLRSELPGGGPNLYLPGADRDDNGHTHVEVGVVMAAATWVASTATVAAA